jgi:hypothetical protein
MDIYGRCIVFIYGYSNSILQIVIYIYVQYMAMYTIYTGLFNIRVCIIVVIVDVIIVHNMLILGYMHIYMYIYIHTVITYAYPV